MSFRSKDALLQRKIPLVLQAYVELLSLSTFLRRTVVDCGSSALVEERLSKKKSISLDSRDTVC